MTYTTILQRIRLLIPEEMDGHYKAVCRGFEDGFDGSELVDLGDAIGPGGFGVH
jgi:hypothetical protein